MNLYNDNRRLYSRKINGRFDSAPRGTIKISIIFMSMSIRLNAETTQKMRTANIDAADSIFKVNSLANLPANGCDPRDSLFALDVWPRQSTRVMLFCRTQSNWNRRNVLFFPTPKRFSEAAESKYLMTTNAFANYSMHCNLSVYFSPSRSPSQASTTAHDKCD
jgi:hypothetical protein